MQPEPHAWNLAVAEKVTRSVSEQPEPLVGNLAGC